MRTLGAVVAALALGCGRPDGESWAKAHLGDQADALRAEAVAKTGITSREHRMGLPSRATALPRPYVVLEVVTDWSVRGRKKLAYTLLNEDRGFDFPGVAPRAIVVLVDDVRVVKDGPGRYARSKRAGAVLIHILDRATGAVTVTEAPIMNDVRAALDALPDQ